MLQGRRRALRLPQGAVAGTEVEIDRSRADDGGDLAEFLEIYGIPLRVGKYPSSASEAACAGSANHCTAS